MRERLVKPNARRWAGGGSESEILQLERGRAYARCNPDCRSGVSRSIHLGTASISARPMPVSDRCKAERGNSLPDRLYSKHRINTSVESGGSHLWISDRWGQVRAVLRRRLQLFVEPDRAVWTNRDYW